jgi:fibronectin-binding autotransporter adhesin
MLRGTKKLWAGAAAVAMTFVGVAPTWAANGSWTNATLDNDWDTAGNWAGNIIAGGIDSTATFTSPDVTTGGNIVTQNFSVAARDISNLIFGDSNVGTGAGDNWDIQGALGLNLIATSPAQPTVTVNAMNPGGAAILNTPLSGTQGFAKAGVGQLTIGNAVHTLTGPVNVNAGTLRLDARIGGTSAAEIAASPVSLANGTTLIANTGSAAASAMHALNGRTFIVAPAGTVNIQVINSVELGKFAAPGATLNFTLETAGSTFTPSGDWNTANTAADGPAVINVSSPAGIAYFSPTFNNNAANAARNFDAASLAGTTVNLTNNTHFTGRTGSGGNTIQVGALTGDATSALVGGGSGGGTWLNYQIGALNTNTTFAGTVDMNLAPAPNPSTGVGGLSLTKVGTGTLTLSGVLNYAPTTNTTHNRRGGITTINGGTLKLTGPAALLGGLDATNMATLRFGGGTLDVSTASTPASTAAFQQVIGSGTILGAYTHGQGILAPGDTLSQTAAATTINNVAGTMTFGGPLSFNGTGEIKFNVSPSTVTGNDLIQVNGTANLTGNPTLTLGLIGGITTGQYTIVNTTGGFGASNASGWTVGWTGRGSAPALSIVGGTKLVLNVTPSNFGSLNWSGSADGTTWDLNGVANWHNNSTNAADKFFDNDSVTFGDTYGPGNTPVTNPTSIALNTTVSPLNMVFNSNTVAYSITGAGKISGAASLTKTGSTLLTLQTANDFSGNASISGTGGVDIGLASTALGTGTLTLTNTKLTTQGGTMGNSSIVIPAGSSTEIATVGPTTLVAPALSGEGDLLITNDAARRIDLGSTNGFTGDLTFGAPASPNNLIVRLQGSSLASSKVTLNNTSLRDRATSAQVQTIGALEGDATSSLWGYEGGSTSTGRTWRIGALNTSTTFHGVIQDSINATPDGLRSTNLHKIGTGTLTLTGGNTDPDFTPFATLYTGRTAVEQGTLSISPAVTGSSDYLANAADVLLFTGGILNLNIAGETDVIDQLFVNGINLPIGTYGGIGSAAAPGFQLAQITGSGLLQVTTYKIPGDFDGMNGVNADDLAVWKTAAAATTAAGMAAGDTDGDGDADGNDFLIWQRYLGTPASVIAAAVVPEPASALLAAGAMLGLVGAARRRK